MNVLPWGQKKVKYIRWPNIRIISWEHLKISRLELSYDSISNLFQIMNISTKNGSFVFKNKWLLTHVERIQKKMCM